MSHYGGDHRARLLVPVECLKDFPSIAPNLGLLGNRGVGKSSVMLSAHGTFNRVAEGPYDDGNMSDVYRFARLFQGVGVCLSVWDPAGDEYSPHNPACMKEFAFEAVAIFYDVTNRQSFLDVKCWYEAAIKDNPNAEYCVVVANKCDLIEQRQVSSLEGKKMARRLRALYLEASGTNWESCWEVISTGCYLARSNSYMRLHPKYGAAKGNGDKRKKHQCLLM